MSKGRNFAKSSYVLSALFVLLATAAGAGAQGRYANTYSKRDVSGIISTLEQSSNTFRRDFDRYMDESPLNGSREEDRLNGIVKNYENSLNRLRRNFDSGDSWWRSRNNVQDVVNNANPVNDMMNTLSFARRLERQWNRMRTDVNKLADTYDLPGLNGGGWNGGGPGGPGWPGGGTGSAPAWAVGTFFGRNPQTGGSIQLTINRTGQVTVNFDGNLSYGTMNGRELNLNGARARVTQISNGIRTRRNDTGETIDYYRGNGGGNIGGNVPSWAVGSFNARSPQDGSNITMTIRQNGEVFISFSNGGSSYGTIYGTTLTVNGATAVLSQIRNGIRTTRTDNGERINYYR